jgi:hypothetical protein
MVKQEFTHAYLTYCKARGFPDDPEACLQDDDLKWPGGKMTGYILWVSACRKAYAKATGDKGWNVNVCQFQIWLLKHGQTIKE